MERPAVSVVMSVYNGEPYIRSAVQSILDQTFADLEMIVVDDGSTDSTPQTLSSIQDPRLRVIRQENRGQPAGLNAGLRAARAELITFMDGDDLCDRTRVERQAGFLREHPEFAGVGTWELVIDAKGRPLDRDVKPLVHEEIVREYAEGRTGLNGMSTMVRAEVFRTLGGFREQLHMANDVDMWMRATERFRFACMPECLYWYRQHPQSSNTARRQANQYYRALVNELRAERLATGSDRLARGERIAIPDFQEDSGERAYRDAIAWYDRDRSRHLVQEGRWAAAWYYALISWRAEPFRREAIKHLIKCTLLLVLPFGHSAIRSPRAVLAQWRGRNKDTPAVSPAALHGTLVRDIRQLSTLAAEWDALVAASDTPQSFFLTSTCILPFWQWYGHHRRLTVVLVRDADGQLVGAAPFYVERVGRRLSRHSRLALLGSPEGGADYLDVLARPGYRRLVWQEALRVLARNRVRWQAINLDYILDDSPSVDLVSGRNLGRRFFVHREESSVCPYAELTPTWEEFVASLGPSTRRGMKYQMNLLTRTFKEVRFETVTDAQRIPELLALMISYKQHKYGHQFDNEYVCWHDQALKALAAGQLRLIVLWLDGCPACVWFTFLFNRRVFFQACSYEPGHASYRLGKVVMPHAIRLAIEEGAAVYDMKRGDADYKYHWANAKRRTIQVTAVRRSPRGAWIMFWEYGRTIAWCREHGDRSYRKIRRGLRSALTPIARHYPVLLPGSVRERVLRATVPATPAGAAAHVIPEEVTTAS